MPQQAKEVAQLLQKIGFLDIILPFILVFTITYAMLQKTKVLGTEEKTRKINAITALVISIMAVLAVNVIGAINILIRYFVMFLMILFFISLILGMVGAKLNSKTKIITGVIGIALIFALSIGLTEAGIIEKKKIEMLILPFIILTALVTTIVIIFSKIKEKTPAKKTKNSPADFLTPTDLEKEGTLWEGKED